MLQAARSQVQAQPVADRARPAPARSPPVQRKASPDQNATQDRRSMLLVSGVQAKPMVQRMSLADAELDEAKKLADAGTGTRIQRAGFVSSPEDASEREADKVADAVVSAPAPKVGRVATAVQRMAGGGGAAPAAGKGGADIEVEARIRAAAVGGKPLSRKTRALLEPRFDADFSNVRIHDDAQAARLSTRIGARAFAYGNHIFFNEGQFQPDTAAGQHLLAHELTHTIQQRASVQRKSAGGSAGVHVGERTGPQASRLGVSDALDYFAEAAYNIPGFRMFTILIGVNPINMQDVDRSAANILRAIVEFLPGGVLVTTVLDQFGVFETAGTFVEEQLASLGITGESIRAAINAFLDDLSWDDIFDLDGVWERAKRIFTDPIDRIITFVGALFDQIVTFVREAVLSPLAALVEPTEGYGLLKQILGYDPITGEQVERDVGAIVGGLLRLAGQEELWNNIQEANALERIGAWFTGALDSLIALVVSIPDRFVEAFEQIEITDFIDLPGAVAKVLGVFGSIVVDFGAWILDTVLTLLTIIVEVVAPGVMPYLQRAGKAFDTIVADPIAFVGNLVAAAKRGFELFSRNFVPNLRSALIQWLTGAMAGANIHIPQAFSLQEILKFVLSVLGLTWENVRPKLVRVLGETAVTALETGFELVTTLVTEGPAAAWQQIVEMIGNLQEMVIEKIISFVTEQVIQQAVIKLVSFLNPAGALIQAIIAIYNTVMFFVERLSQMAQVAAAFIDGIAEIAEGKLDGAAAKVEQTMVGLLSLVISFLARLVGLGNVARAVTDLIEALRRPIDAALDRLIDWIVQQARRFMGAVRSGAARVLQWWRERRAVPLADGKTHHLYFEGGENGATLIMASEPKPIATHLAEALVSPTLSTAAKGRARIAKDYYDQHLAGFATTRGMQQPQINQLAEKLNEFSILLRAIPEPGTAVPVPAPQNNWSGPVLAEFGPVTNQPSRGGEDSSGIMGPPWDNLTKHGLTTSNGRWVRMHMISAAYGGVNQHGNFIPAPTAINTGSVVRGFETLAERTLYGDTSAAAVRADASPFEADLAKRKSVLWFRTEGTNPHPAAADSKGKPLYKAGEFVGNATFKMGQYILENGAWTKVTAPTNVVSVAIDPPDFSGTSAPNINQIGATQINLLAGDVGLHYAAEVVRVRGIVGAFANGDHFIDAMIAHREAPTAPDAKVVRITPQFEAAVIEIAQAVQDGAMRWS